MSDNETEKKTVLVSKKSFCVFTFFLFFLFACETGWLPSQMHAKFVAIAMGWLAGL